jgi:hypothetical protein
MYTIEPRRSPPPVVKGHGARLAGVIVATLGLTVASGCATKPAPAPALVLSCPTPPPPPAPAPAAAAPVARMVARPAYVRPVIPPLPAGVYQQAQRRTALPARTAESVKTKDDAKS